MDTCNKVANYFKSVGFPCNVIGVPKTVDNDLVGTHHCPGYGSAAKFVATSMTEIALDTAVYEKGRITVCEIMGRDAGWLTAASVIANPDLIYLPEVTFDTAKFFEQAIEIYGKTRALPCCTFRRNTGRKGQLHRRRRNERQFQPHATWRSCLLPCRQPYTKIRH